MNLLLPLLRFVPMPYVIGASVAVLMASHGYAWFYGRTSGMEKYYVYKSEVEAAVAQAEREAAERTQAAEARNAENADAYDTALGTLARSYNSRLERMSGDLGRCETMSRVAASVAGVDAAATNAGLAAKPPAASSLAEACRGLEVDAAKTTAQVVWLQDYILTVALPTCRGRHATEKEDR